MFKTGNIPEIFNHNFLALHISCLPSQKISYLFFFKKYLKKVHLNIYILQS